jgi:aldehyde:ferredoxin oxidoreductase
MKAKYGYMGKILFVNLSDGKIQEEDLSGDMAKGFIGGYGIGARILLERMKPRVAPLGPDNILGIGTGPFTGSGIISTNRFTTMGKSPLTGYWGDANSGGNLANALKATGYDLIFFEGKAESPVYVLLTDERLEIKDASHIWGKDTAKTEEIIRNETGDSSLRFACIGPVGEKCSLISAIINDGGRAAGRSGLGAVMGSKNLKAVACRGSKRAELFDKALVQRLNKDLIDELKNNPSPMAQVLSNTGTPGAVVPHLATHDTPIKNWGGNNIEDFPEEKWGKVAYEAMEKYITGKYACTGCPIACGGWMKMEAGKYHIQKGHKPEYETIGAFGPDCLNDDVDSVIYANELCNLNGFDTISAGATIAFAIECFENGILTKSDTDGVELTWGNSDAIIRVL